MTWGTARVLKEIARARELDLRLTHEEYLPRRRAIEAEMHSQFVRGGGTPSRESPHYAHPGNVLAVGG
jgi:hypothetical protein